VAYIADAHAGPYFSRRRVAKVIDRVLALKPDLILIGGDNVGGRRGGAQKFYPEARRLKAPLGVYGVLGNHDYWEGEQIARADMAAAGIRIIDNTNVPVQKDGAAIALGGVEDFWEGQPNMQAAARGVSPEEFALLLTHNPDVLAEGLPRTPGVWDVALTGHMHAGQITFFGLWAPIVPSEYGQRYRAGWVEELGTLILISNGIGEVTVPLRFFAPPEVNLITLRRGPTLAVEGAQVKR
jgi:predicted MPP superfamily phosphohydrolase